MIVILLCDQGIADILIITKGALPLRKMFTQRLNGCTEFFIQLAYFIT